LGKGVPESGHKGDFGFWILEFGFVTARLIAAGRFTATRPVNLLLKLHLPLRNPIEPLRN
jgi:hypothetical protein